MEEVKESNIIEPYGFIYITTNLVNGKRYIGQRVFNSDWKYYLGSGTLIKKAIKKYKRFNFKRDIIAIGYNQDELNNLEINYIKDYNAVTFNDYYNIADGGKSGNTYAGYSEKQMMNTKLKMSRNHADMKGKNHPQYGKHLSDETKLKMRMNHANFKGKNSPLYGKHVSNEVKEKLRIANLGKNSPKAKKIICVSTNKIFDTIKSGADFYNLDTSSMTKCCKHKIKYSGKLSDGTKLVWKYYDEYLKEQSN